MNKPTSPVILAIGAHVGDMELTAGGLLSTCAMQNWTPVIISLTTSEKSASATDDLDKFIEMKRREATSFVTELHGQSIIYDIPDGFLVPTDSLCLDLCALIRKLKPQILITHYQSTHKDHMACHTIVNNAVFMHPYQLSNVSIQLTTYQHFITQKTGKIVVPSGRKPFLT